MSDEKREEAKKKLYEHVLGSWAENPAILDRLIDALNETELVPLDFPENNGPSGEPPQGAAVPANPRQPLNPPLVEREPYPEPGN